MCVYSHACMRVYQYVLFAHAYIDVFMCVYVGVCVGVSMCVCTCEYAYRTKTHYRIPYNKFSAWLHIYLNVNLSNLNQAYLAAFVLLSLCRQMYEES